MQRFVSSKTCVFARVPAVCVLAMVIAQPALADENPDASTKRTRIFAGPEFTPAWTGSDRLVIGPFVDYSSTTADKPFEFEASDESVGATVIGNDRFAIGGAFDFVGSRSAKEVGGALPKVGISIEAGAFAQAWITPALRVRVEGRRGISGHKAWVSEASADYVVRDGDKWLFSIGPRLTLSDGKYARTYFGVTPAAAQASGLAAFKPSGGLQSVGVSAGLMKQFGRHWGIAAYGRYDRLVGDAANSPVVRTYGSRGQPSVGLALSYTFGGER